MKFVINEHLESQRELDADYYDYQAGNELVTFWKTVAGSTVAVFTCRLDRIQTIEAKLS